MPSTAVLPRAIAAVACLAALHAGAATVTVTSSADVPASGACTLREAILSVNAAAPAGGCAGEGAYGDNDRIGFDIAGDGTHVITLTRPLPPLRKPATIDGYTQPGAQPNALAERDYPNAQGLDMKLRIQINGSFIHPAEAGLMLTAPDTTVRGLSIIGFDGAGIFVNAGAHRARISGNLIGLDVDGKSARGNGDGVRIEWAKEVIVGGPQPADRNLIAMSSITGSDVQARNAHGLTVAGNLIGTDITGASATVMMPDSHAFLETWGDGVSVQGSNVPVIRGNVIAYHERSGVCLSGVQGALVTRNAIGIGVGGVPLGNGDGVHLMNTPKGTASTGNTITGNGIAANRFDGIVVSGSVQDGNPRGNRLDGNSIYGNGARGVGINLWPAGENLLPTAVTPNDPGDADTGPNDLQNFPVITQALLQANGSVRIDYTLDSEANQDYSVSAYANPACSASGHGEGRYGTGQPPSTGTSNASGQLAGHMIVPAPLPPGWGPGVSVSLLATNRQTGNTSEFSACALVTPAGGA